MNPLQKLYDSQDIQNVLEYLKIDDENTLKEHLMMCEIPAPSFQEEKRGDFVLERFQTIGLLDVHKDEVGNVLGIWPGTGDGPTVVLAAHLDTVFPPETDVTVKCVDGVYYCPGINDDTRAVAELLTIARALVHHDVHGTGDIIFCANVCEEGLGDLRGVKHLFEQKKEQIDAFVSIDNQVTGGVIYTATGSLRYEVTVTGPGGHSFKDFGIPNPIHALGRIIAKIAEIQVLTKVKTTFNIGVISGGTSVNTIAQKASFLIDLRSDGIKELEEMREKVFLLVEEAVEEENQRWNCGENADSSFKEWALTYEITPKGNRPAGQQIPDCNIVKATFNASELVGVTPQLRYESSTDSNIPISLGIPAVTVGRGGQEGKIHTLDEWHRPMNDWLGPQRTVLLVLALTGVEGLLESQL